MQSRRSGAAGGDACPNRGRGWIPLKLTGSRSRVLWSDADRRFKSASRERQIHNRRRIGTDGLRGAVRCRHNILRIAAALRPAPLICARTALSLRPGGRNACLKPLRFSARPPSAVPPARAVRASWRRRRLPSRTRDGFQPRIPQDADSGSASARPPPRPCP